MVTRPFVGPEKWCNDRHGDDGNQKQQKRRLLEPSDGGDAERQQTPNQTNAPCHYMNAGSECPQC